MISDRIVVAEIELAFVFEIEAAPHVNGFGLGGTGRHRTNVWVYARVNVSTVVSKSALVMHPTTKPVAIVPDALRDCILRGPIS
ncbi:hypothetical protein [Octadecabacter antarcticus]|uniref:hypothetical protein n=1 Tax=Octadecabacter antarcticus TaxID=1217908 RepID=UPI00018066CE|nr:hypothetical protein [Octadecabacter antarcticus]